VEVGRQVRLFCSLTRHLTGLPLPLSGYTGSNRWQLDSKTEKVPSLTPDRGILTYEFLNLPTQNLSDQTKFWI